MFERASTVTIVNRAGNTASRSREAVWAEAQIVPAVDPAQEETETITPDTDVAMTWRELAEAFKQLGNPTAEEDVELTVDPDDYPLF